MIRALRRPHGPILAAGLAVALLWASQPAPSRADEDDEATPAPAADAAQASALSSGPMLGYVSLRSATVWVQTKRPAQVQLRYWPLNAPTQARLTDPARTEKAGDLCLTLLLDGLEPGTRYGYELYLDGEHVARPYPLRFETAPLWQWRTEPPDVALLIGSCAYINEDRYERPGRFYGGQMEIFKSMAKVPADAMIWMGDNVYFREVDYATAEGMAARYRHDRALPELQALLAHQPNYAMWDDHDYGPNDSDGTFQLKDAALDAFRRYWPAPAYGTPKVKGAFQRFQIADADVFLLDDRYHRSSDDMPDGPDKRMIGRGQMEWLKQSLVGSRARFKLIVSGGQVLNRVTPYEAWQTMFPQEQKELLDWIVERRVEGVVFLSGDRHHTEILVQTPSGGYPLYDITCSPLTSGPNRFGKDHVEWNNPDRVPGTLLQERNFGVVKLIGKGDDRRLAFEAYRVDGTRAYRHEIQASKLRWENRRRGRLY